MIKSGSTDPSNHSIQTTDTMLVSAGSIDADDHTIQTTDTPGFKPLTMILKSITGHLKLQKKIRFYTPSSSVP